MDYLLEAVQRLAPHPLGGRIRGHSLRMGLFQLFQPAQQLVVFKVRD